MIKTFFLIFKMPVCCIFYINTAKGSYINYVTLQEEGGGIHKMWNGVTGGGVRLTLCDVTSKIWKHLDRHCLQVA